MRHYLINPTWHCQNQCEYCWVERTVRLRPELFRAEERPVRDWINAIKRDDVEVVDIAGGEPLLMPWILALMEECPDTRFGLSTNGLSLAGIEAFAHAKPSNLVAINVSYHPGSKKPRYRYDWMRAVMALRNAGGRPHVNIVDYQSNAAESEDVIAWLKTVNVKYELSPYEDMDVLTEWQEQGLCCKGGEQHLTIAPDGTAWPCLSWLRSPHWEDCILGNWLDGEIDVSVKPQPCHLFCIDYHILKDSHEAGDMWLVEARPCES